MIKIIRQYGLSLLKFDAGKDTNSLTFMIIASSVMKINMIIRSINSIIRKISSVINSGQILFGQIHNLVGQFSSILVLIGLNLMSLLNSKNYLLKSKNLINYCSPFFQTARVFLLTKNIGFKKYVNNIIYYGLLTRKYSNFCVDFTRKSNQLANLILEDKIVLSNDLMSIIRVYKINFRYIRRYLVICLD